MADPYRRYSSIENDPRTAVPGSIPSNAPSTASHPGYIPSNAPSTASHQMWRMSDSRGTPDLLRNDVLPLRSGGYGLDDHAAMGSYAATKLDGLATGDSIRSFSPLEDPALARRDVPVGIKHDIMTDGLLSEESNILFVDNLPTDCTRREVAHLFRPFIGFKEIRVVHKEPRRTGDKAKVLCFVEFDNAKCALTALEALQGYKFDDKKPDAPVLRIQLVKFPFRPTSLRNDRR